MNGLDLSDPLVAIEIGTTRIRCVVGQVRSDQRVVLLGSGSAPSRGVRKSEVIDIEAAIPPVREALHQAELASDVAIRDVNLVVSAGHLESMVNTGRLPLGTAPVTVTPEDVEEVMGIASSVPLSADRVILHTIRQTYDLDSHHTITNPVGMEGCHLSGRMLLLHGEKSRMRNGVKVLGPLVNRVPDVAFSGLCAGMAVLDEDDQERGTLLIDMGGGTTSYIVSMRRTMFAMGCFGVGGEHVTHDLARALRTNLMEAEALKHAHGSAIVEMDQRHQRIPLKEPTSHSQRFAVLGDITQIAHHRAEETLQLVRQRLNSTGILPQLAAGVILTGGASRLRNMPALAEKVFGLNARAGRIREVVGLSDITLGPEYASVIGMLRYAARDDVQSRVQSGGTVMEKLKRFWGTLMGRNGV